MKFLTPIWENQNSHSNHFLFQCVEALMAFICPLDLTIFLQNIFHGCCNNFIALNEISIVSGMSQHSAQGGGVDQQ
jgi:hypothetical protein